MKPKQSCEGIKEKTVGLKRERTRSEISQEVSIFLRLGWNDKALGSVSSKCLQTEMRWQTQSTWKADKEVQKEELLIQMKEERRKLWSCSYFYWWEIDFTKQEVRDERERTSQILVGKQAVPWTTGQFVLRTRTKAKPVKDYVVGILMINTLKMKERGHPSPNFVGTIIENRMM